MLKLIAVVFAWEEQVKHFSMGIISATETLQNVIDKYFCKIWKYDMS
jgi:hypothetical protein